VIRAESGFNPRAVSRKGAQGLMQLMPSTASVLVWRNSFDPRENIDGGVRHLRGLLDRFPGNLPFAIAAYNAGEKAVTAYGGIPPYPETQDYVVKVLRLYGIEGVSTPEARVYQTIARDGTVTLHEHPRRAAGLSDGGPEMAPQTPQRSARPAERSLQQLADLSEGFGVRTAEELEDDRLRRRDHGARLTRLRQAEIHARRAPRADRVGHDRDADAAPSRSSAVSSTHTCASTPVRITGAASSSRSRSAKPAAPHAENAVFSRAGASSRSTRSSGSVRPKPLGYCSVTTTGAPRRRAVASRICAGV